ncbi:uncharacterized protein LOC134818966 [Bolinopsis microptera]|uniref:uncharacterized protein LOC134818966 n=1 Tax=Bolinopsis microptera TaxID=2820187 RepID=UPI00307AF2BB
MIRFIQIVLSVIAVLSGSTVAASDSKSYTALKFAYDGNSLVTYSPDMTPFTDKFTICVWVRKLQSGGPPAPFGYKNYEIFMTDNGYYNILFGSRSLDNVLTSKFTSPVGTWFMYCSTWSLASRTFRVYVNGELAGTQTTPSGRKLQTGGAFTLGSNSGHYFGGELFNFNMYSKEMTATEVAAMSSGGLCTEIPEQLEEYRVIKWEDIVKLSRSGTVQDLDIVCTAIGAELQRTRGKLEVAVSEKSTLQLSMNRTQIELQEVQGLFNSTQEELVGVKRDLEVMGGELNDTKVELEGVKRELGVMGGELNETKSQLEDTKLELEDTKLELKNVTESKCALQKGNLTKWDMFYSPAYYNKTFTRRLYQQLTTTWDSISSRLLGMTITDKVIELIKDLDDDQIYHCGELLS